MNASEKSRTMGCRPREGYLHRGRKGRASQSERIVAIEGSPRVHDQGGHACKLSAAADGEGRRGGLPRRSSRHSLISKSYLVPYARSPASPRPGKIKPFS